MLILIQVFGRLGWHAALLNPLEHFVASVDNYHLVSTRFQINKDCVSLQSRFSEGRNTHKLQTCLRHCLSLFMDAWLTAQTRVIHAQQANIRVFRLTNAQQCTYSLLFSGGRATL